MHPLLVFYSNSDLLEGPVFDQNNNLLYFVSILDYLTYCYDPSTKEILSIQLDSPVSCIFLRNYKKVLVASKNGFFEIDFNTLTKKFVFQVEIGQDMRYNDGIKDPLGRLIVGTMGFPKVQTNKGSVLSFYKGQFKSIIENTSISNGLAFSPDGEFLYFIDTPTKKVAKYQYDLKTGSVLFDSYVIEITGQGSPDGMCIDPEGMLWIAEWGGGCVSRWNPSNGERIDKYCLPCLNITSCCLDGDSNLFVTTAKSNNDKDIYGGGLYYIELSKN